MGVGGSSPLIPTKSRHLAKAKCFSFSRNELQIFANEFWRKEKAILHKCKMQGFVNMMARTTFLKDPSSYIKRQRDIRCIFVSPPCVAKQHAKLQICIRMSLLPSKATAIHTKLLRLVNIRWGSVSSPRCSESLRCASPLIPTKFESEIRSHFFIQKVAKTQ